MVRKKVGVMVRVMVRVIVVRFGARARVRVTLRFPEEMQNSSAQEARVMVRQPSPSAAGRMDSAHLRV